MDAAQQRPFDSRLRLRQLTIDDFDALVAMQLRSFPGMKPWAREQIAWRTRAGLLPVQLG